jgi:hypothetical protein
MSTDPIAKAERLLHELEQASNAPPKEFVDWVSGHRKPLSDCIRSLLEFHAGYKADTQTITSLALRLLAAIAPLFAARGMFRDYIEGTAPDLRSAYEALKNHVEGTEQDDGIERSYRSGESA